MTSAKLIELNSIFDAPRLRRQLEETEKKTADPNFWSNPELSQTTMRERKRLGLFLWQIMSCARHHAMNASAGEFRRARAAVGRGRNAVAIWQDLVDDHGFPTGRYTSFIPIFSDLYLRSGIKPYTSL